MKPLSVARLFLALLLVAGAAHVAFAASSPFGIATPDSPGPGGLGGPLRPLFLQIAAYQSQFYQGLTHALTDIKENGWAVWLLLGLSFAYGVFHAAGPGHGKAVISAYLISSGETVRRGIALSFMAAFVQAVSAVLLVSIAAMVLHVTAVQMTAATDWFEILSYALVALVGAWLLWSKAFGGGHHHHHHHGVPDAHGHDHDHGHTHDHAHHDHAHEHRGHDHVHDASCAVVRAATQYAHHDHAHHEHADHDHAAPAGNGSFGGALARAWSAVLAVGIRPCSGAIIILVFALSQGLFAAGVAATFVMALGTGLTVATLAALAVSARSMAVRLAGADSPLGERIVHIAEICAAAAVLLLGLLLLGGALVNGLPG